MCGCGVCGLKSYLGEEIFHAKNFNLEEKVSITFLLPNLDATTIYCFKRLVLGRLKKVMPYKYLRVPFNNSLFESVFFAGQVITHNSISLKSGRNQDQCV